MILQYRGFSNNVWCYEEADTICSSLLDAGNALEKCKTKKYTDMLEKSSDMYAVLEEYIEEKTGCYEDEIIYHSDDYTIEDMDIICVVNLQDKNKHITRVFYNTDVYLLNNRGQTVQKLLQKNKI